MRLRPAIGLLGLLVLIAVVFAAGYWVRGPSVVMPAASQAAAASPHPGLPNPRLTPGAVNPAVTPDTIGTTICKVGWASTVRPPSAYTAALKLAQIIEYGYADRNPGHYQEDHLVPLKVGGAPRDPRNLWPQPETLTLADGTVVKASEKDGLEDELRRRVCAGTMDLGDAQRLIAGDWFAAWQQLGEP